MSKPRRNDLWVVVHCEIMGTSKHPHVDEMVFHVASSRPKAERYLRASVVAAYSWWKLLRYKLDDPDSYDAAETLFYTHKGKPVASPPIKLAFARFKKWRTSGRPQW
jgi:hypothetical protein